MAKIKNNTKSLVSEDTEKLHRFCITGPATLENSLALPLKNKNGHALLGIYLRVINTLC